MTIKSILDKSIALEASDIHLSEGRHPIFRVDSELKQDTSIDALTKSTMDSILAELLNAEQTKLLKVNREIDFSFSFEKGARFRVNVFFQKGVNAIALRKIPLKIPTFKELNLPELLLEFCRLPQGLVLVTGPSGHGKSTTLASMLDYINQTRTEHILTIEDPIEYVFSDKKSIVDQRELHDDTSAWDIALKSSLREDPDVLLIGEMRDLETISSAVTIAETGHLVFATLHTNSCAQSIDRIVDVFPEVQQQQIRVQLSQILEGVVSQRLIKGVAGGRFPACEIMFATPAVRNLIREGKTHQLDNVITTSSDIGMQSLDKAMADLVKAGKITLDEAKKHTLRPLELSRMVSKF